MKAFEIAEAFRACLAGDAELAADPNFAQVSFHNAQTGESLKCPVVICSAKTSALNDEGTALTFTFTAQVESTADRRASTDPDPAIVHAARVEAIRARLVGAGKSVLLNALNAGTEFDFRGWGPKESEQQVTERQFSTPDVIFGTALVLR